MAQQADGAVYIDSLINTDGVEIGAEQIEKSLKNAAKTISEIGKGAQNSADMIVSSFSQAGDSMSQQEAKVEALKQKLAELSEQKVATEEYSAVNAEIEKLETSLDKVIEKEVKFTETGGDTNSRAFKSMEYDIEKISADLDAAKRKKEELEASGGAYQAADTSQVEEKLDAATAKLEQMKQKEAEAAAEAARLQEIANSAQVSDQKIVDLNNELSALKQRQAELGKAGVGVGYTEFDQNSLRIKEIQSEIQRYQASLSSAEQSSSKFSDRVKSVFSKVASTTKSSIKKLGGSILGLNKDTKKSNVSLGKSLKTMLKYGLGIRSIFVLVNKLRSALVDGFKNLAQYDGDTNKSISSLMSSLTQLKNSFATAFAPILNVVAPILSRFINMISQVVTHIGMLMASLTGQSTFKKAIGVQEDYAASMEGSAGAAKDAEKATTDYLSGLDEVQKFNSPDKNDSGSGGGGGSGAGGQNMFETVPIESGFNDIAEKIKEAWRNADFTEIGTIVGEKIKNALENIPWDGIKSSAQKISLSVGTFINGFFETEGLWQTVGKTLAQGLNTAILTFNTLISTIKWDSIGKAITGGLQSFLQNTDFSLIGNTVSSLIISALDFGSGLLSGIDWRQLPFDIVNAIVKTIQGFDFKKSFESVGKLIGSAFVAAIDLISGISDLVKKFFKNVAKYFAKYGVKWNETGENIVLGIFRGIADGMKNIGTWIKKNILDPFVNGFKKAFKIGSPSRLMYELATFIITGLLNGLKDTFLLVLNWLQELPSKFEGYFSSAKSKIVEIFDNIGTWFKEKFESAWISITSVFSLANISSHFSQVWQGITSIFSNTGNWFKAQFDSAWNAIKYIFSVYNMKSFFSQAWSGITSAFGNIADWFKSKFSAAWQAVKNVFSSGGQIFSGIKEGILSSLKAVVNGLISGINKIIAVPFNGLNTALRKIKGIKIGGLKPFNFISTLEVPKIPYLATGAVIPPNAPFMAVLGDQRNGNNLEMPEGLLRKIIREETGKQQQSNNTYKFVGQINRRTLFEEMMSEAQLVRSQTGINPFEMA